MAYYKEIVTKAIVGKGKKVTNNVHTIKPDNKPNTVLGCWIINHNFSGNSSSGNIYVNGSYDVNIWYSYDNDSKTGVCTGSFNYNDKMNIPVTNEKNLTNNTEVIVNTLSDPNVIDVKLKNDSIEFEVRKEMGIEIVGDTKIKVNTSDDFDDYVEILDDEVSQDTLDTIDKEVNDEYLKEN